jgi:hypothetical protein
MLQATQMMTPTENGYTITLNIHTEENKKLTAKFLDLFGYKLDLIDNNIYIKDNGNKNNWQKHLTLLELGYSIENITNELKQNKEIKVMIPVDYVVVPLPLSIVKKLCHPSININKNILRMLAENTNFTFMILSLYNLDTNTLYVIDKFYSDSKISSWRRLLLSSDFSGWAFYKISPYLQANSDIIYTPIPRNLINGPAGIYFNEYSFIKNWISNSNGKFAYFMRALFELNPDASKIIFNNNNNKLEKEINLLYYSLPLPPLEKLSSLYDLKDYDGFPELARALKIKNNNLYFPGKYEYWLLAINGTNIPSNISELTIETSKQITNISYLSFFKELAKYNIKINEVEYNGINIFFHLYNFFLHREELASKENIVLLFRNYPFSPELLIFIDKIKFKNPSLLPKLIFKIHELENSNKKFYESNMRIFQSTLGLLSILSLNNTIAPAYIEKILSSFLDIPLDSNGKYGLNFMNWFCNYLLANNNCQTETSTSYILDMLLANIPNKTLNINGVDYTYNMRDPKKYNMLTILNNQKIPSLETLILAYQILSSKINGSATNSPINFNQNLNFEINSSHPIDAALSTLNSYFNSADKYQNNTEDALLAYNNLIGWFLLGINYSYWLSEPDNTAYKDNQFIVKHDMSKVKTSILIKFPWKNTKLVTQDPKKGMYIEGSVASLPEYLSSLHLLNEPSPPESKIINDELSKWVIYSSLTPSWDLINDDVNSFLANLYMLGIDVINSINSSSHISSELKLISSIVGKPRINIITKCLQQSNNSDNQYCKPILNYFTPSDLFFIGRYHFDNNIRIKSNHWDTLINLKNKDPEIYSKANQFGYAAPLIIGTNRLSIELLPPYEKLERYYTHAPIAQRFFDHKIVIANLLYNSKLPSELSYSLWEKSALYIISHLYQNYTDDWESLIYVTNTIDQQMINRWIQELKAQGSLLLE